MWLGRPGRWLNAFAIDLAWCKDGGAFSGCGDGLLCGQLYPPPAWLGHQAGVSDMGSKMAAGFGDGVDAHHLLVIDTLLFFYLRQGWESWVVVVVAAAPARVWRFPAVGRGI